MAKSERFLTSISVIEEYIRAKSGFDNFFTDGKLTVDELNAEMEEVINAFDSYLYKLKDSCSNLSQEELLEIVLGLASNFGDTSKLEGELRLHDLHNSLTQV